MRSAFVGVLVAVILVAAGSAAAVGPEVAASIDRLVVASGGRAEIARHHLTGAARIVHVPAGSLEIAGHNTIERAVDALDRYGAAFGVANRATDTTLLGSRDERLGGTVVVFGQRWHGMPVLGAELRVRLDAAGQLTSINGLFLPAIAPADTTRRIDLDNAKEAARAAVAQAHALPMPELVASDRGESVYRRALVRNLPTADDRIVRQIEVRRGDELAELVLVSVTDGLVVERIPLIHDITRVVHHHDIPNQIWSEGDPLPFAGLGPVDDTEVNRIIAATGDVYRLFANLSGGTYLSWTGNDTTMKVVHDTTELACPNAQWTGGHVRFCLGTGVDDVIAHEWTHAYTQATHGLIYLYQQGALNESYSDIFGEIVDLLDPSGPTLPEPLRATDACSSFASNSRPRTAIISPSELAGELTAGGAAFNPLPPWSVEATAELAEDGVGMTLDGCEPLIGFTAGNIAVLEVGRCLFQTPVETAAAAGAAGAIVINRLNDNVARMPGDGTLLAIPAVMIGKSDGARLKAALADGVTIRIASVDEASVRWLMGEDSPAFGNAIRDMWTPECLGDPGAVTSARYWCGEDDNGGVHVNSGIPNHAFALLADGGSTPAGSVRGIALTRAAHIYWRAMSVYQIPLTDFADHADLLELSCTDLIGATLTDLVTGEPSSDVISADDCTQLARAIDTVALRIRPAQCGFRPVLKSPAPAARGDLVLLDQRFDTAPTPDWELSWEPAGDSAARRDWIWTTDIPAGGDGGAFYAADLPYSGHCDASTAGAIGFTTPAITLPDTGDVLLVFDHYLASQGYQDGGNLKLSVNGGTYELIPPGAFLFNPYNRTLTGPPENSNPLAGEPAWSGCDDAGFDGSWGQSQVDLTSLAAPGDTIRIRFEFGNDACIGGIGWYIDTIRIVAPSHVRHGGARVGP